MNNTFFTLFINNNQQAQIMGRILLLSLFFLLPVMIIAQCDREIRLSHFPSKMIEWNLEISKSKNNFLEYELKIELEMVKVYKPSANIEDVLIIEMEGYKLDGVGIEKLDKNFYAIQMDLDYENNNAKSRRHSSIVYTTREHKIVYLTIDQKATSHKFEALGVTRLIPHKFNTGKCSCKINYIDSFSIERIVDLVPSINPFETYGTSSDFKISKFVYPKAEVQCIREEDN